MKKALWVVVSNLMALSLVMAACAPAATPTTPTTPTIPTIPTIPTVPTTPTTQVTPPSPTEKEAVAPTGAAPKYGGTLTYTGSDMTNFDSGLNRTSGALQYTVYQEFMGFDWTRGPAGSGVTDYSISGGGPPSAASLEDISGPEIAESWQIPEQGVWILKIRQGVHWQFPDSEAGRLMAGRQLTADDIVSGFNRLLNKDGKTPDSVIVASQPAMAAAATIEKTGPWEVTIKAPVDYMSAYQSIIQGGANYRIYPPEVVAKYGNLGNWRNALGTGPFMLVDYVPGSQVIFKRNPNYWETDPLGSGKGNQLPYIDALRQVIIPDLSTTIAALRTGVLDLQGGVSLIDAQSLFKTNPQLKYLKYLPIGNTGIGMTQTNPKKPWSDVRVRQALMLATDFGALKSYYGGEAEIDVWPMNKGLSSIYQPLSAMPEAVQSLYRYNPDRAKQLLKDAGYPGGFKTSVVTSSSPEAIDVLSIYKDMWSKVGIDLTIDIKESGVYSRMGNYPRSFDDMYYGGVSMSFVSHMAHGPYRGTAMFNRSDINNPPGTVPYLEDIYQEMSKYMIIDMTRVYELERKVAPFVMEQAYVIPRPTPYTYNFWWPWLKNYYGQTPILIRYAWADRELKKEMGH